MHDAGNQISVLCDNLEGWNGEGGGSGFQEGGDICIPNADSCWSLRKTITILYLASNLKSIKLIKINE